MRLNNPLSTPIRSPLHGVFTDMQRFPDGSVLHFDANIDPYTEQTGGPHTFNHAILSPQYQRNADGSYTDVGAKPAVDVFDGEKWLRSCGAVTNLLPSGAAFSSGTYTAATFVNGKIVPNTANSEHYGTLPAYAGFAKGAFYTVTCEVKESEYSKVRLAFPSAIAPIDDRHVHFDLAASSIISKGANVSATIVKNANGTSTLTITRASTATASGVVGYIAPLDASGNVVFTGDGVGGFFAYTLMLTATSYPVPYTPPGTTMPASNATTTNGMWFSLPDGSPLWQALTGSPLTLATRVMMGVGSGDGGVSGYAMGQVISCQNATNSPQYYQGLDGDVDRVIGASDGVGYSTLACMWQRNSVIRRFTQVNTAGTQFRVGYMIEGTHTTIQWSAWVAYDGSFDPSTLYRLMLGFNNAYPMWFNKITAWKEQVTDAEILEAMA